MPFWYSYTKKKQKSGATFKEKSATLVQKIGTDVNNYYLACTSTPASAHSQQQSRDAKR